MRQRKDGKTSRITFLDTPGHEAFKNIRTRGASVADIAVLIVAGDDGVKPQTLEVLKYILESKLPYLVAITKVDKSSADVTRTKQSLAESGVLVEGYGGDVSVVEVSAKTGQGVEEFLDMIDLIAEMENFSGNMDENGSGVIIEANLDPKRGVAATGIVKNGIVRKGMFAACGDSTMPIRFLLDAENNMVEELSFSSPVRLIGWDKLPPIGEEFKTFLKKADAEEYAREFAEKGKALNTNPKGLALESEGVSSLSLIIKADTAGSLEAVRSEIGKLSRERILPRVILASVGSVGENDVKAALATPGSVILAFHTKIDSQAASLAERTGVEIFPFDIIYELTDKTTELLATREPRIEVEEISGSAKVLKLFSTVKNKQVLGARVVTGFIAKGNNLRIMRREAEIGRGKIKELQMAKVDAPKVEEGSEFGALIESKTEIAPGDILEAVSMVIK
ncbi:MAG: Translation initiation factor IF-2 protein [Parcubacteria group bacterium GW2011_GWB1_49_7]|nr:MAG: Translation initiation factor IF-2 protein [Parcubacteria group bacterium GW2011_GWB1_49_7]